MSARKVPDREAADLAWADEVLARIYRKARQRAAEQRAGHSAPTTAAPGDAPTANLLRRVTLGAESPHGP